MRRTSIVSVVIAGVIALSALVVGPATAAPAKSLTKLTFTATVTSSGTTLQSLPGSHTFGWNHLGGPTTWGNQTATIDWLADINYTNGSGPFHSFITITRQDGTKLALDVVGSALAVPQADGTAAHFTGNVSVIQGTGAFRGATGIGTFVGDRAAALGSPVNATFTLAILKR